MKHFVHRVIGCLLALAVCAPAALAAPRDGRAADHAPADYIVVFRDGVESVDRATEARERAQSFRSHARYRYTVKGFAARLTDRQAARLRQDRDVAFVSLDRPVKATASLAAGETVPPGIRRIEAATASTVRSAGANVGVIDTGVDLDHPDLNVVDAKNCVNTGRSADDDNGHGTHVAGTIAARNTGRGVVGVAPGTRVYALKALDSRGSGSFSGIICAIDWAAGTRTDGDAGNDIAVVNLSLSGGGSRVSSCSATTDALHKAVCRATAAGVVFAVAAGNSARYFDDDSPDVPAAYPQVLTVTAMADTDGRPGGLGSSPGCRRGDADDRYASFSNYAGTSAGAEHTLAAPGVCVVSTWPGGGSATMSGTSMAAPHVAGALALCIAEGSASGPCAGLRADDPRAHIAKVTRDSLDYGFLGDPYRPVSGAVFGRLGWTPSALSSPSPPSDTSPPAAPTGLAATAGDGRVGLDWADNGEADLAGYDVLRSTTAGGSYTKLNGGSLSGSAFTDTTVTNGTRYFYVVRAVDTTGNASGNSAEVSATPQAPSAQEPSSITLTATGFRYGNNYVYLQWNGADSRAIDIYRNGVRVVTTDNDGSHFESLGTARGTFRYEVCEGGSRAECSNEVSVTF